MSEGANPGRVVAAFAICPIGCPIAPGGWGPEVTVCWQCDRTMTPLYAAPPRTVPVEVVRRIIEARKRIGVMWSDDGAHGEFESAIDAVRPYLDAGEGKP